MAIIIRVLIDNYFSSVICDAGTVKPHEKPEWGNVDSIYQKQAEARAARMGTMPAFH